MLALTKKTDYALIALSYLARCEGSVISARELSRLSHVPQPLLTNILKTLAQAGVVISERGSLGGYTLAKPPSEISLYDLLTVMEGPFQFVQCVETSDTSEGTSCDLVPSCPIRQPAQRIHARLKDFLTHVTLDELVAESNEPVTIQMNEPVAESQPKIRELAI